MKRFCIMLVILSCLVLFSNACDVKSGAVEQQNDETEIRTAICEIENKNFKAALAMLEGILKKDPKNIYALRLLPGAAARQIKPDDKSPENLALVRKAVEAYETAAVNPLLKNDREDINRYIVTLYGMIGGDEKTNALLKKAENESETPKQRAVFYTTLAADNYLCANEISDGVKSTVKQNGKDIFVFRQPQNPADFEKLKNCAAKGAELIQKAVALDPASETAFSYRASLFIQQARIAEMEGKADEKARLTKEYEAARDKFIELSGKRTEQARKDDEKRFKSMNDEVNFKPSEAELKQFAEELKSYRLETKLDQTIDRVDIPLETSLVAPPFDEETPAEPEPANDENQKRAWKVFSPEGAFSADLPDNADFSSTADSRIYTASGDGLSFFILDNRSSVEVPESQHDAALNVLAWTLTKYIGSRFVGDGGWNNRFESDLTRKDKLGVLPARFYAYRTISCKEKKDGTMVFVIGKKKTYAIDIRGAGESDARVQRFLKSLKLD